MNILLAIDSSAASEAVVAEAASRPWPFGTVFCVVSVVDMWSWEGMPALIEDAKHEAQGLVKKVASTLRQPGYEVYSEIQLGVPKKAIPDFAAKWEASLILIGARGLSALTRFVLGSVAQAVLRTSPCSVEVVRRPSFATSPPFQGMKILLGTDGSEFSSKAAYSVAHRPWPPESQVRVISVRELLVPEGEAATSLPYSLYSEHSLSEVSEVTRKRAEDAVAEARSILRSPHLEICATPQDMPVGDPRTTLLDEAGSWGADLIVVGSHGRRGFDRLLLGSVSESVALHAHCSVEVIRG